MFVPKQAVKHSGTLGNNILGNKPVSVTTKNSRRNSLEKSQNNSTSSHSNAASSIVANKLNGRRHNSTSS